ncbi:MAG: ribosomal protein [Rickettsiaceae bacterium]|nr:ribosomal protein [Rickettsiaceae bacterium]
MYFTASLNFKPIIIWRVRFMPLYESTFIVRQDVSAQEVDKIADNLAKIITDYKGKVVKRENWGLMTLAYKVKKSKRGHYVLFGLDTPVAGINELKRQYKLSEDVIRSLTVRVDEISKEPSPLFKKGGTQTAPKRTANDEGF